MPTTKTNPAVNIPIRAEQAGTEKLDDLARLFKMGIREMVSEPGMMKLIRDRVEAELLENADVKIVPTVLRIAAGSGGQAQQKKDQRGSFQGLNIHLHRMTDEQLEAFRDGGKMPIDVEAMEMPQIGDGGGGRNGGADAEKEETVDSR